MRHLMKALSVLSMLLLLSCPLWADAADSKVLYEGNSQKFVFVPDDTNLFSNFAGVMPGDTTTQNIQVTNSVKNNVKIKLYLRAESVDADCQKFLNQMTMTVTQNGKSVLFLAAAGEQDGLKQNACLGTFYSGADIPLQVTLKVPLDMGNTYQEAKGTIRWIFTAEEYPIENSDPKTGDTANGSLIISFMIAGLSIALLIAILFRPGRFKRKQ